MTITANRKALAADLRLVFFGMLGDLSRIPLAALLDAGLNVAAVVVPASTLALPGRATGAIVPVAAEPPASPLPLLNPHLSPNALHLAWQHRIPVFATYRLDAAESLATLAGFDPDLICVACFAQRLPKALLALPRHGCLNLHPSLLPDFRGPAPLFWTFRQGQSSSSGVTVHLMDEGLDSGDVALQAPLALPDGISGVEAERLCAVRGGRLLVEAVQALARGQLPRRPQPAGGSAYPWPAAADFRLDTGWPARRAFNFMRGTAEWGQPYPVMVGGHELELATALAYTAGTTIAEPLTRQGNDVLIRFTPGVLQARPA